jgi:hypothetical protein
MTNHLPLDACTITPVELPDKAVPGCSDEVAFTILGLLPESLCTFLIQLSETEGFRPALLSEDSARGGYPAPNERKCGMVQLVDQGLATRLWDRLRPMLTAMEWDGLSLSFPKDTSGWRPSGVNDKIRILRYGQGDFFKPHIDGNCVTSPTERSFLTAIIYLNDTAEFEGGGTYVHAMRTHGEPVLVSPVQGALLCFDHQLYHEGEAVLSGFKYILRTDIMFTRATEA